MKRILKGVLAILLSLAMPQKRCLEIPFRWLHMMVTCEEQCEMPRCSYGKI